MWKVGKWKERKLEVGSFGFVVVTWFATFTLCKLCPELNSGSVFTALTALYTGLGFAGAICVLRCHQKDLDMKIKEENLRQNREKRENLMRSLEGIKWEIKGLENFHKTMKDSDEANSFHARHITPKMREADSLARKLKYIEDECLVGKEKQS